MSKRTSGTFKRRKHDAYDTPAEAVKPLLPHLPAAFTYWEPCAGAGDLIEALTGGNCVAASDIAPRPRANGDFDWIAPRDAMTIQLWDLNLAEAGYIITNPPWTRELLHPMIVHFSAMRPTWLLFDADWMHTKQAAPYRYLCRKIVSIGRVSWMQNGTSGIDNCAWYLFDAKHQGHTAFHWREAA